MHAKAAPELHRLLRVELVLSHRRRETSVKKIWSMRNSRPAMHLKEAGAVQYIPGIVPSSGEEIDVEFVLKGPQRVSRAGVVACKSGSQELAPIEGRFAAHKIPAIRENLATKQDVLPGVLPIACPRKFVGIKVDLH